MKLYKIPLLLAAASISWGLSNAVTIQETSGSTQTNRVLTIPRYFAQGEICQYPQPYTGGSAVTYWQADIKTRWPSDANCSGGYVKFALITIEITLTASSNTVVEFRNSSSASSGASGLTQSGMLNFNTGSGAGSWGAGFSATTGSVPMTCRVGSSIPCGARDMITAGFYKVLESGPLRTSVLVREGPDAATSVTTRATSLGWQCLTNCTAPYNSATWANTSTYYSIRPSYVITFYTSPTGGVSNNHVEADYLLDNGWMDRAQDQLIGSIQLDKGSAETTSCYTAPAAFVIPFRSRMFETCWQPAAPGAVNIDFSRAYVTYSKVLPAYGLNWTIGSDAINLETGTGSSTSCTDWTCSFIRSDQGATTNSTISPSMGWGQDNFIGSAVGGNSNVIGFAPRWEARYVLSFDSRLLPVVLGNAKAWTHAPIYGMESSTSAAYLTGNAAMAFGRFVSIDARPTYDSWIGNGTTMTDAPHSPHGNVVCNTSTGTGWCPTGASTCMAPNCMVTCNQPSSAMTNFCSIYDSSNTVNPWGQDLAHAREMFLVPYLFTGKYVYLEGEQAMAAWEILAPAVDVTGTTPSFIYSRWGKRGIIYDPFNTVRATAWPLRNVGGAALISPDGSVEQAYFLNKLNNNLENFEGAYNITNGWFPPANSSCTGFNQATDTVIWRQARCYYESGWSNPLFASLQHDPSSPVCDGCDGSLTNDGISPWMEGYWVQTTGQLRDWGFKADYIHTAVAGRMLSMFTDSTFYAGTSAGPAGAITYRTPAMTPSVNATRTGYIQTWAAVKAATLNTVSLAQALTSGATTMYIPDFADTGSSVYGLNLYDVQNKGSTYCKIDSEIINMYMAVGVSVNITAVNTGTSQVTATGHGLTDGQLAMVTGSPIDNGMIGNSSCRVFSAGRNNNCVFYVHVIDANTVRFYNNAGLTSLVTLTGGSSGMVINQGQWTITRGTLGTTAASHSVGATITYWPVIVPPQRTTYPDSHAFFYTTAIATALDHDISVTDAGTGVTITARRAWDIVNQITYNQQMAGNNVSSCSALGLGINNCDEPRWGILPRPLIRNVRIISGSGSAGFYYTAPDGNGCKVGVSATGFPSTDDSGDTADGFTNPARMFVKTGLVSGTVYSYRITCGPSGGAARVSGVFTMQ